MVGRKFCALSMAVTIAALVACGGGGGDPGTCIGSDGVCAGISDVDTPAAVDYAKLICDDVLAITGGSEPAAYALAQIYLGRGAKQLDGDNDGDACEEFK